MGRKTLDTAGLAKLHAESPQVGAHAVEEVGDVPRWAKLALARTVIYGETYEEAAGQFRNASGKPYSRSTLEKYGCSPAGKRWKAAVSAAADDPVEMSKAMVRASSLGVTFDMMWALEQARIANDYKEVGLIAHRLMDRAAVSDAKLDPAVNAPTLVLNITGNFSLDPHEVASSGARLLEAKPIIIDAEIVDRDE